MVTIKQTHIATQLFKSYSLLFLALFLVIIFVIGTPIASSTHSSIIETQQLITQTITQAISNFFEDMNEFSVLLMNSDEFKEAVIDELPAALENGVSQTSALQKAYAAAYQMFEKEYRIGVVTNSGVYIWLADRILVEKIQTDPQLYQDYHGFGAPILLHSSANPYLGSIAHGSQSNYISTPVITLARSISKNNAFTKPQAMLEVHIDQSAFSSYMRKLVGNTNANSMHIAVFGTNGDCFYGDTAFSSIPLDKLNGASKQWTRYGGYMVRLDTILNGNGWVYYQIPEAAYYSKLVNFLVGTIASFSLLSGVMFFLTHSISKKITRPISQLCSELRSLDLMLLQDIGHVDTNLLEINLIAQTVEDMGTRLSASMQEIVIAKTSELQMRLMALQSQMQPHFLYNTLTVISSLCEQGNTSSAVNMCYSLSQMLRYVSSKEANGVFLYEELNFLDHYITVMSERYPQTSVSIDIPLEMMDFRIPKLILQPLCENSFKHSAKNDVRIWISGRTQNDSWTVNIRDNGPGFSSEQISEILTRCKAAYNAQEVLSTSLDGMGLVNIYARLALFYHNQFVFSITERDGITIGGTIHAAEDENQSGHRRG